MPIELRLWLVATLCAACTTPPSPTAKPSPKTTSAAVSSSAPAPSSASVPCSAAGVRGVRDACVDPRCATIPSSATACGSDTDCIAFPATALECATAGPYVATNRRAADAVLEKLLSGPERGHCDCPDGFVPRCVSGTCALGR
jgi:hypothetical protein